MRSRSNIEEYIQKSLEKPAEDYNIKFAINLAKKYLNVEQICDLFSLRMSA